ncbi:MAG: glycosyltransferase family 4 protein [Treponema sp.]|jgi:glycosyltransferase involved in cell wall biosynthesis|nr:glycosyltransferase family 4 protein [Treponema sp.]
MTITIDCRMLDASGVGVYLRECLPYFLASSRRFVLLGEPARLTALSKNRRDVQVLACAIKPFSIKELFLFPPALLEKINNTDLFYSPYFNIPGGIIVPVYATIHDIIFPDMPELTSRLGLMARMWFYRRAFHRSKKIFTVSQFSRSRIQHYAGAAPPVVVTHIAIQPYLLKESAPMNKTNTILFIGNIKRHKGLWCLIEAFFQARTEGLTHKLVIVGEKNNFRSADTESLKKLGKADDSSVEFTGFISNEKLKTLLAQAALLVQPSLYEGFGLPPLEAMVSGTAALVSDIPVFREIYADFPVTFFRVGDSADLKEKLLSLLRGRDAPRVALTETIRGRYTFEKTASIILRELTL